MKVGLFGTGAYGLALSSILVHNHCDVTMWTKMPEEKECIEKTGKNEKCLPGYEVDKSIKITCNVKECIKDADLLIIAIPAAFVDSLCQELKPYIKDQHIVIATKGIEQGTGLFMSQIIEKYLNTTNVAVISGGTFAVDLITKMPAGLAIASTNPETTLLARQALQNNYLKLRENNDMIGIEICGSIKNVIALAAGMLAGLKANDTTKAMFITEATHDMEEILKAFGSDQRTVMSFAGLGDLILTCTSVKSRNYRFGQLIGEKKDKKIIDNYLKETTVEGYYTLESIYQLLNDKDVKIPIIDLIYDIAVNGKDPDLLLVFLVFK